MQPVYAEGDHVIVRTDEGDYEGYITGAFEDYFTISGCPPAVAVQFPDIPVNNMGFFYEDVELHPA